MGAASRTRRSPAGRLGNVAGRARSRGAALEAGRRASAGRSAFAAKRLRRDRSRDEARAGELEAAVRRRRARPRTFTPAEPEWTPLLYADTRAAWTGSVPGAPGQALRVEAAASYRGKPVLFYQVAPWTTPTRMAGTIAERSRLTWTSAIGTLAIFSMFVAAGAHRAPQPAQGTRRPPRRVPARGVRLARRLRRRAPHGQARRRSEHAR